MCVMEYLTHKNATDPIFPLEHAEYWENISVLCLFFIHVVWRRVTKAPLAGNSFETEANIEASPGGLISVLVNVYM